MQRQDVVDESGARALAYELEVIDYAELLGEVLSESFKDVLTPDALPDGKMYYNIANRTVKPLLRENFNNVNQIARSVNARGFASKEDIDAVTEAKRQIWEIAERL